MGLCDQCFRRLDSPAQEIVVNPSVSIRISTPDELVHVLIKQDADLESSKELWAFLDSDDRYKKQNILYDASSLNPNFSDEDVAALVKYTGEFADRFKGVKLAIVVSHAFNFRLGKIARNMPGGPGIDVVPFWSFEEAREWISEDSAT